MNDPLGLNRPSERSLPWLQKAEELAAQFAADAAAHDRERTFPFDNFARLKAAGFHRLTIPAEYGGWGATLAEAVAVVHQLAMGDGPTALVYDMHVHVLGSLAESRPWPEERFAALCREIVEHGGWVNSCATEPELGSPSRGGLPKTRARKDGAGWRVTGRKTFTSGSYVLTHMLIPAVIENAPEGTVGVFLVRAGRPGIRIDDTWDVMGMRTTASNDLIMEDVPVDANDLVVERQPGAPDPARGSGAGSAWFGLTVAGVYLGIAEAARDAAIAFAHERRPTALKGDSIATLPPIQGQLGALEVELLTARTLLRSVADAWTHRPEERAGLMAHVGATKAVATAHAVRATDLALRVVGGQSMSRSLPLERLFRDVRAGLFHPPTEELANINLGKALLGL